MRGKISWKVPTLYVNQLYSFYASTKLKFFLLLEILISRGNSFGFGSWGKDLLDHLNFQF